MTSIHLQKFIWGRSITMPKLNKLVRDYIPNFIKNRGGCVEYKHLDDQEEFIKALISKMKEEVDEFDKDRNITELADMYEVFMTLVSAGGFCMNEVMNTVTTKRSSNGGFDNRIFLLEYSEKDESSDNSFIDERDLKAYKSERLL